MTSTEFLVIVGGVALGYWLVGVVWPIWRDRDDARGDGVPPPFQADPPWPEVLDVAADADRETIETAHRARREEYSPERMARLRAKARAQAHLQVMLIDRAYAAAMRELGMGRRAGNDAEP